MNESRFKGCFCIKGGFTLIELLVVVLIIGILAALAVPQYQLAVNKTRFAKLHSLAATYSRAARIYYELHGEYPKEISKMDVDFPAGMTSYTATDMTCAYNTEFYCCVNGDSSAVGASVTCGQQDYSFAIRVTRSGQFCIANQNDNNALRLCSALGESISTLSTTMWPYPGGYTTGKIYILTN